jgi:hypothetical protein
VVKISPEWVTDPEQSREEQQDTLGQITKQITKELKITPILDKLLE